MTENILNISELEKKKRRLFKNIAIVIFCVMVTLFIRVIIKWRVDDPYLETTLFVIRTFNFILALLASASCLNSYERLKDNSIFIISLVYIALSTGILFSQLDYLTFYYGDYGLSEHVIISTGTLRAILLIVAIRPQCKLHNFIMNNKMASIIFVVLFTIIAAFIENHIGLVFEYNNIAETIYKTILTIIYMIVSIVLLLKGVKDKEYLFIIISASIFMLVVKNIFSIYTGGITSFYVKLVSICITYISSLIIIGGNYIELYIYINKSRILTENLKVFHSIVDNNKHTFMVICDENKDAIYINKKVREYYSTLGYEGLDTLNDVFNNISDELDNRKDIANSLNKTGTWRGIIKNSVDDMMLDCSIQSVEAFTNNDMAISYMDISDEIKKELELEKLKIYTNERTEFMSNISHELRTPLNIFYSTIQLLDRMNSKDDAEFKLIYEKYRKTLHTNCKRMLRLINNVVDISKIETGTLAGRFDNYNIVSVVEDVTLSVVNYAKLKNINIEFDTNTEENIISCDPNLLERVMLNLLSNAIKFSPKESTIYVNLLVNEDFTEINVKDEGIGISKEYINNIFERFVQADKSLTRQNEGSGIGLSIVKSIVDLHDGYINLESELGKGSNFKIILPNNPINNREFKIYDIDNSNIELELSDIYEVLN